MDFALNTTTFAAVLAMAQRVLGARGVLGFVSATREPFTAPLFPMLVGGQSLRGIVGGDSQPRRTIPLLLEYWRQGRFPVERLITRFAFADIAAAFAACRAGTAIKPVLEVIFMTQSVMARLRAMGNEFTPAQILATRELYAPLVARPGMWVRLSSAMCPTDPTQGRSSMCSIGATRVRSDRWSFSRTAAASSWATRVRRKRRSSTISAPGR